MSSENLDPATVDLVDELLGATGHIARRHFYGSVDSLAVRDKGEESGYDPVTVADREIEAVLRTGIGEVRPGDRIVGEENGVSGPEDARRTWFLDPVDGTKAFLTGMTGWGTLVGLVDGNRAVAGWMDQPVLGERYRAVDGRAVRERDTGRTGERRELVTGELATSGCTRVEDAISYTTHPSMFDGEREGRFTELARTVRLQRYGGDCYAYCQLAAGRVDLVVEAQLNAYDIVALIPIVEAAGGVVTGPDGRQPLTGGAVVAAATAELAERAWDLLGR